MSRAPTLLGAADSLPEPGRIEGMPHPRETPRLYGQAAAEAAFLDAFATGRLHHGWLLTGPRGIGKATLAWRIARFLLATPAPGAVAEEPAGLFGAQEPAPPPRSLDIAPDHPVARRVLALSEPGLHLLRRGPNEKGDRLMTQIGVDEVRKLKGFFSFSAADGGHRVAIVDAADELNPNAANALLKILEEPPPRATLLLVAHQPSRLLPTIRSRCRELRLAPLWPDDMAAALAGAGVEGSASPALATLAGGSVGEAVRILAADGLSLYAELVALLLDSPRLDRPRLLKLADSVAGRGNEARFDLVLTLLDQLMARLARAALTGPPEPEAAPGEARLAARIAPDPQAARLWAGQQQALGERARRGRAVNLDPAALLVDMVLQVNETAAALAV
jgi:DNA polymerase-3 subunit delta'